MLSTVRLIGGAIATAIYTAVRTNRLTQVLAPNVIHAADASGFTGNITTLLAAATKGTAAAYHAVPGISNQTIVATGAAVKESYAESFQLVYEVAVAFGGLALLCALTTRNIPKSKKTSERPIHLENEPSTPKNVV